MAIGFWIFVGEHLVLAIVAAWMMWIARRGERSAAMMSAVLDKIEKAER